ncbi:MAG TPA: type II restriction endonuclease [Soehngenia sp.]|nr:type II restriction endonuclease [Soehngenia sp.]
MNRNFDAWFSTLSDQISTYEYCNDFKKVYKNVESIKIELNILNSLIGSKNIKDEFKYILKKYPETAKCIPILLAVRASEIFILDNENLIDYSFKSLNQPSELYCEFMEKTGLFELMQNHLINNLFDYVTGVETGLDTHGRKNRGGHIMEKVVENYFLKIGLEENKDFFKEVNITSLEKLLNIKFSMDYLDNIKNKRFDFVVINKEKLYLIETNFYSSSGSKLNETARSYRKLNYDIEKIDCMEFIWITDGKGWKSTKNSLEEAFNEIKHLYNLNDLRVNNLNVIFKGEAKSNE